MKRSIYAAIAALMMLAACEYHPYYDGQVLRIYQADHGLIEADGVHLNVPIVSSKPFELEIYGGKGKHHKVTVSDPDFLGYTYKESNVEVFLGEGVVPATLTLKPQQLGDTSITIRDEDTGESISIYIHIVKAFSMLEIYESRNSIAKGIMLAFEYASGSDVMKICRKDGDTGDVTYLMDARFRFVDHDSTVIFELTYLADVNGQPDAGGNEIVRRFLVEFDEGGVYGSASAMMHLMNLDHIPVQTRDVGPEIDEYLTQFRFVDITDNESPDVDSPDTKIFYATSARLTPWIFK